MRKNLLAIYEYTIVTLISSHIGDHGNTVVDQAMKIKTECITQYSIDPFHINIVHWCQARHAALMTKSKDWYARNQNNVSDMFTRGLLFQWVSTIKVQCWSSIKRGSSSFHCKWTCSRHDIAEKLLIWRQTTITHSRNTGHTQNRKISKHWFIYFN